MGMREDEYFSAGRFQSLQATAVFLQKRGAGVNTGQRLVCAQLLWELACVGVSLNLHHPAAGLRAYCLPLPGAGMLGREAWKM